ncbi:MAG: hypothetical protein HYU64_15535, partial [Armatimonadetes bacterium]|nr:hypothetical protein [Armatimonadota bacterium]
MTLLALGTALRSQLLGSFLGLSFCDDIAFEQLLNELLGDFLPALANCATIRFILNLRL